MVHIRGVKRFPRYMTVTQEPSLNGPQRKQHLIALQEEDKVVTRNRTAFVHRVCFTKQHRTSLSFL
jgi:hypothetical protein